MREGELEEEEEDADLLDAGLEPGHLAHQPHVLRAQLRDQHVVLRQARPGGGGGGGGGGAGTGYAGEGGGGDHEAA